MNKFDNITNWVEDNFKVKTIIVDKVPSENPLGIVGIDWKSGKELPAILVEKISLNIEYLVGGYIHELAHILLNGDTASSEDNFLGWEFMLAMKFSVVENWLKFADKSYVFENEDENKDFIVFSRLSFQEKMKYIIDSIDRAIVAGYLERDTFNFLYPGYEKLVVITNQDKDSYWY